MTCVCIRMGDPPVSPYPFTSPASLVDMAVISFLNRHPSAYTTDTLLILPLSVHLGAQ